MGDPRTDSGMRSLHALGPSLAGGTDVGVRRSNNEDAFHIDERGFFAVADGLGGLPAGEAASALAIETVVSHLANAAAARSASALETLVAATFAAADGAIRRDGRKNPAHRGMATTLVIGVLFGDSLVLGHVGDVRAYRLGAQAMERLTEDHTEAWEWVTAGLLSEAEAAHHPYRNSLTRALGVGENPEPSLRIVDLEPGDVVMLCSDGLWDPVGAPAIQSVLEAPEDASMQVLALLDLAIAGGGPDNVTVVTYRHGE